MRPRSTSASPLSTPAQSQRMGWCSRFAARTRRASVVSTQRRHRAAIDLEALGRRLEALGSARRAGGVLVVDVEGRRITIFADGRALIRGVNSEAEARTVYAKYVGI